MYRIVFSDSDIPFVVDTIEEAAELEKSFADKEIFVVKSEEIFD
jgi:nitrogen regulatory protein PII